MKFKGRYRWMNERERNVWPALCLVLKSNQKWRKWQQTKMTPVPPPGLLRGPGRASQLTSCRYCPLEFMLGLNGCHSGICLLIRVSDKYIGEIASQEGGGGVWLVRWTDTRSQMSIIHAEHVEGVWMLSIAEAEAEAEASAVVVNLF